MCPLHPHQSHIAMDTWIFIDSVWYNKLQWTFIFYAVIIPYLANKSDFRVTSLSSTHTLLGLGAFVDFWHKSFQTVIVLPCPRIAPRVSYFLCWKMVFRNNDLDSIGSHYFKGLFLLGPLIELESYILWKNLSL